MKSIHIDHNLIHPLAIQICQTLQNNQFQAFIVGGCVRDLLLGQIPKDWDITTSALPEKVIELFPKTIPTGLQHGTVTVVMGEGTENHFEVTTFRTEGKYIDGRRPENVSFVSRIEEDLARRDLTINAIAYDPINEKTVDPFNGMQDLQDSTIRAVGNPNDRFQEDGLRIMRTARFAARFGYQINEKTLEGMSNNLETLKKISKERIRDELCKILMSQNPNLGLRILARTRVLPIVCPFLKFYSDTGDVPDHEWKGELETRLTYMLLLKSLPEAEKELEDLKFSNREIDQVLFLFQLYGEWYKYSKHLDTICKYKRFMSIVKNRRADNWKHHLEQFCLLCDMCQIPIREKLKQYEDEQVFARKDMVINGDDLIALGIPPGPQIKEVLNACYQKILEEPNHNFKPILLSFAQREFDKIKNQSSSLGVLDLMSKALKSLL